MHLRERAEVMTFKDNRVLANLSNGSYVVFPGGGINKGETPIEAAKRECLEETARRATNLTPAHPPTVQIWPEDFAKSNKWAKDYKGGYTYWMTASASDDVESTKHKDYEDGFQWHPIKVVLERLKHEAGNSWANDVHVRIKIIETHMAAQKPVAEGEKKEARLITEKDCRDALAAGKLRYMTIPAPTRMRNAETKAADVRLHTHSTPFQASVPPVR